MINYYKILELSPSATSEEIREAYRRQALRFHPDVNDSPEANTKFLAVGEAYDTLNDPISKQKYDLVLEYGFEQIADAIKREKSPIHRDRAYSPKSAEYVADYVERKNMPVKKTKQTLIIESLFFSTMVFAGVAALTFSIDDLMAETWEAKLPGLSGLVFSVIFLGILAVGWKVVLGRKYWF